MQLVVRLLLICVCAAAAFGLSQTGILSSLEHVLERQRLELNNRAPSGDIVFVEIDSASLRKIDTWPWPRTIYADLLNVLMDMGADEVAFDIDFSSRSTEEADAAFEAALDQAGGYASLATFEQISGITGELERSSPLERFSKFAYPVVVNVILDRWGDVRSVPLQAVSGNPPTPAIALALGRPAIDFPATTLIDFSIDMNAIDRISVADILTGAFDINRIAGKRVVIGASAIELRDFFSTPRFGIMPGPLVQIAATETVSANRVLREVDAGLLLLICVGIGLFGLAVNAFLGVAGVAVFVVVSSFAAELAAIILFGTHAFVVSTTLIHAYNALSLLLAGAGQAYLWLEQRRSIQARLEYLATIDETTGVRTRHAFVEKLQTDVSNDQPMVVLVVQIRRLDTIRGALGHFIANGTLREIAHRLDAIAPDYVARVGDERFAIATKSRNTTRSLNQLAEQISFSLSEPFNVDERLVHIDIEMAGASVAEVGENALNLVTFAELSLGHGVKGHSGRATLFDPLFADELSRRRQLDLDMRTALTSNQFKLVLQPQVRLKTGKMVGVEALIRWQHPELGFIPPPELIELAEETGFIVDLGRWVLREACALSAKWDWSGRTAVNVSALQIELGDFPSEIRQALAASGLPPTRLELEVTETILAGERYQIADTLETIRSMGVTVALDDFGTGYSSLSYIHRLPFDMLKIDRSFVIGLESDPERRAIVEAIISMAKQLGKTILVEGIETVDQRRLMLSLGCDLGQGYLFSKPVDPASLSAAFNRKRA